MGLCNQKTMATVGVGATEAEDRPICLLLALEYIENLAQTVAPYDRRHGLR
tara:strand:+ start:203 stop:355 length:153 start_codon:yes stop_codon:yes gene_type:complete